MLISTSRKPSQKTRKFCKNLSHTFNYPYTNRGKSSIHDLLVKAKQTDENGLILVYEIKGNPSKITFLDKLGEEIFNIQISAEINNTRLNIQPSKLKIKSQYPKLNPLIKILDLEEDKNPKENYIHFKPIDNNNFLAEINFYNKFGEKLDLKINVKKISQNKIKLEQ